MVDNKTVRENCFYAEKNDRRTDGMEGEK